MMKQIAQTNKQKQIYMKRDEDTYKIIHKNIYFKRYYTEEYFLKYLHKID